MVVYKFGGASVKSIVSLNFLKSILSACSDQVVVVVSAMDKTTNRLEEIVKLAARGKQEEADEKLQAVIQYHKHIADALSPQGVEEIHRLIEDVANQIRTRITEYKGADFNFFYDQVVTLGEVLSTRIVSHFLSMNGISNEWMDIRGLLKTNSNYRDAQVDLKTSESNIKKAFSFAQTRCYVTQGFIGSEEEGNYTSLGREGSDYTAALIASMLNAKMVTLWKDVAGIYNADPAHEKDLTLLKKVRYQEMIELAYYGAKVIHPKTIKPLRSKQIPLFVKCFFDPEQPGTEINEFPGMKSVIPVIIRRHNQVLISITLSDLSFITEKHLSKLFKLLYRFRLKANMMQHGAVSFSFCVDEPRGREVYEMIDILRSEFKVLYNEKLTLTTIRHYDEKSIQKQTGGRKIFVEQRSRSTVQYLTD